MWPTVALKKYSTVQLVPPLYPSVTEQGHSLCTSLVFICHIFNRKKMKLRKTKVPSFYFDINHLANYWGIDGEIRR